MLLPSVYETETKNVSFHLDVDKKKNSLILNKIDRTNQIIYMIPYVYRYAGQYRNLWLKKKIAKSARQAYARPTLNCKYIETSLFLQV